MSFTYIKAAALAAAMLGGSVASATDRIPNVQELAKIEAALKANGYKSWKKIELDAAGHWEVDDAADAKGRLHDLDLAKTTLQIVRKDASSDRLPNATEKAAVAKALQDAGFTAWKTIKLDDNRVWEVDDARHTDGFVYDLDLDKNSLKIVKKDRDS